jgi:hypothetical protein
LTSNPFVSPNNYEVASTFSKINATPCRSKMVRDISAHSGRECFTVVNGNTKVYTPAFEERRERRKLEKTAKDRGVMPYGPLPRSLREKSFQKSMSQLSHPVSDHLEATKNFLSAADPAKFKLNPDSSRAAISTAAITSPASETFSGRPNPQANLT